MAPSVADMNGHGHLAPGSDRRQRLGRLGEALAAEHLERRGFTILDRNYRTRWGELDLVAFDGRAIVFCEVKTRREGRPREGAAREGGARGGATPLGLVSPLEAVGPRKQARVRRMAGSWLRDHPDHPYAATLRFDAIGITCDRADRLVSLEHLEGAW